MPKRMIAWFGIAILLLAWLCAGFGLWLARTPVPRATTLRGISRLGQIASWSPSGDLVATLAEDTPENRKLTLWDTDLGTARCQINGPFLGLGIEISPDESLLAVCTNDRRIQLWEIASAPPRLCLQLEHPQHTEAMCFAPDSRLLVIRDDEAFKVFDLSTKSRISAFDLPLQMVGFSADGQNLVCWEPEAGGLILVDWKTGAKRAEITSIVADRISPSLGGPQSIAPTMAANGQMFATGFQQYAVYLWDSTGKRVAVYDLGEYGGMNCGVAFSADSKFLAVCREFDNSKYARLSPILGDELAARLFPTESNTLLLDTAKAEPVCVLPPLLPLHFKADGKTLVGYSDREDAIIVWDIPPRMRMDWLRGLPAAVPALLITALCWYNGRRKRIRSGFTSPTFAARITQH